MAVQQIVEAVMAFDEARTADLVQAELAQGTDVAALLNDGLIAAIDEVGRQFHEGVFFVPEMFAAARAMKAGLRVLRPLLARSNIKPVGTIVIGTVKGDRHDIGKNLVAMMLEGAGFNVIDLGVDVDTRTCLAVARENNADIVALSALLTTTMPAMEATVARIKGEDSRPKTLVGGAPVTQAFADNIGADGYGPDARSAVIVARQLVPKERIRAQTPRL